MLGRKTAVHASSSSWSSGGASCLREPREMCTTHLGPSSSCALCFEREESRERMECPRGRGGESASPRAHAGHRGQRDARAVGASVAARGRESRIHGTRRGGSPGAASSSRGPRGVASLCGTAVGDVESGVERRGSCRRRCPFGGAWSRGDASGAARATISQRRARRAQVGSASIRCALAGVLRADQLS
ncbi:hypothetical protein DFH09DRAFT_1289787 [Mycena vulgaris]|nr:hypothetical protein DFH09DRAFT_1289787 [Mycena vulgaris]